MTKEEQRKRLFWYFLIAITIIQTLFAVIWLVNNHGEYHEELMANNYIKASKDLVVDDNMGIGYALFVRLFGFGRFLYFAQALVVAVATWYAFSSSEHLIYDGIISVEPKAWLVAVFVLSNPFVLQSICMVLPNALILAGILLLVGGVRRNNLKIIMFSGIFLCFLNPDFVFVFPFAMLPVAVYLFVKKKGKGILLIWGAALVLFLGVAVTDKISNPYSYGGVKKDITFLEMQRVVEGSLSDNAELMEVYYHMYMYDDMKLADKVPEHLALSFARKCELAYGKNTTDYVFDYLIELTKQKGRGFYWKPIIKDFCLYTFSPYTVLGSYISGVQNTSIVNPLFYFLKGNMGFGKMYLAFSTIASFSLLAFSITILWKRKLNVICNIYPIAVLSLYATFVALRGFDYRNVLYTIVAWPLLALLSEGVRLDNDKDINPDNEFDIDSVLHGTGNF